MYFKASVATRSKFGISPMADATAVEKTIQGAGEAKRTKLLVSAAADNTARWCIEVVLDITIKACEAARAHLGEPLPTNTTSAPMGIDQASETAGTCEFAISSLADPATAEHQIKSTGKATRTNFFEAPAALTTAWTREVEINQARKAT